MTEERTLHTLLYNPKGDRRERMRDAAPEMYDELYEVLQLLEGKSSWDGDEFSKQAQSIKELLARIDGKEDSHE